MRGRRAVHPARPHLSDIQCAAEGIHIEVNGHPERTSSHKGFSKFPYLKDKPYWGNHFWAPGYCIETVGLDAAMIRKYVKYQENKECREDQLPFKF